MDIKQVEALIVDVVDICPLDVRVVPTKRRKQLLIIKLPPRYIDLDDWAILHIQPLHWNNIFPLIKKDDDWGRIRCLYCCGDKFVLYSPDLGKSILYDADFHIDYFCSGDYDRQKYIGTCFPIERLISFLVENTPVGF